RLWLAKDRVKGLLHAFVMAQPFYSLHFDAALRFTDGEIDDLGAYLRTPEGAAFIDWLSHDYPLPSGGHIIDRFIERIAPKLPGPERALAASWRTSTLSVWQARRIVPGEGLEFEDLLCGGTRWVRDIALSQGATLWGVFVARLLPVGRAYTYFGGVHEFRPDDAGLFVRAVEAWKSEHTTKRRSPSRTEILKSEGYKLYGIARDLVEHPDTPELLTPEGDPLEFSFAAYHGERLEMLAALGAMTALERVDDPEAGATTPDFVWWAAPGEADADDDMDWDEDGLDDDPFADEDDDPFADEDDELFPDEGDERSVRLEGETDPQGRRSLAHFTIKGNRLLITCLSWERLDRARDLLEAHAGAVVEFLDEAVLDPRHVLDAGGPKAALVAHPEIAALLDEPRPSQGALDPALKHGPEVEFIEEHYRTWPDQPLPALNGQTPRAAVRTARGRAQVEALLRSMEYAEGRREPAARDDIGQLRRALGLPAVGA
ncbi:MAG TPA: hypothetical protein VFK80_11595, partial [Limnochordia bacterium]|nr:hypothetical protein [Limnochordia bacterium]